jgi:hypothetical protein
MTTDTNWVHEDNPSWFRRQAIPLSEKHKKWESKFKQVWVKIPDAVPTWKIKYEPL